jgi:hypothetical protein
LKLDLRLPYGFAAVKFLPFWGAARCRAASLCLIVRPAYGGAASNDKTATRFYPFDFSLLLTSAFSP